MDWGLLESDDYISEDVEVATHVLHPDYLEQLVKIDNPDYNNKAQAILLDNSHWISVDNYLKSNF